jgi:hypothetical protein
MVRSNYLTNLNMTRYIYFAVPKVHIFLPRVLPPRDFPNLAKQIAKYQDRLTGQTNLAPIC